ncbi:VTT domain-containing protein [Jannaschia sp. Os4]|uniref:VTT domain-containing protein n=1 Tax=Jannaschia sp. Os4 TaxID=2807617 RepID=UPI00193AB020|nr:VTT domain-containing protein [Jannaschia sp. Os4]MBM2575485.1 VTT domain-containing protein [Jannaschia sp. Os4]
MRPLLRVMLLLGGGFAATFVIARLTGVLTEEAVRGWLAAASAVSPAWIAAIVVALLFADLFVAVPTLTITILAGHFLGAPAGTAAALAGTSAAAAAGYGLSRRWGEGVLRRVVGDPAQRVELRDAFARTGPAMIVLSRAMPILPEVTACMAGATRMPPWRYVPLFALGTVPYVAIAAWAGSVSTLRDPMPAIYAVLGLYAVLWTAWAALRWRGRSAP